MKKQFMLKTIKNLSHSQKDFIIIIFLALIVFILSTTFNFFDMILVFIRLHDSWQLDDLIVISIFLVFALAVFSYRRSKELKWEIHEKTEAEGALLQANKKLNLLFSITRHDINNQLMSVDGFLEILHQKVPDPLLDDCFMRISNASARISAMILFTKEYEKIGVTAPAWQDIPTLIDTATREAPLGMVVVKNDLPPGIKIFGDPLILKVFYNLMDNAVRYGGKITTIRFFVEDTGNDLVIICQDDGVGIPSEEKDKIFGRGFGKNTGLGLALSREILAITGITITETGEPGKGARFEMTVPKEMYRFTDAR